MFVLALITLLSVFIGGHMVKSDMIDGILDIIQRDERISNKDERFHIESFHSVSTNVDENSLASDLYNSLEFYPSTLDFGLTPVGSAVSQLVMLVNKNANRSVYLSSISGKTSTFYSSFFEDKIVAPQSNTTFNVVFLPRSYDNVKTSLLIHTSFGQAKLLVKGKGKECPYRLKPLVGIKAPFNATLRPEILMYNPHATPIQILEVYSSGGQFQLELPSGGQEGPQALWEIPPLTTKPVIRIKFHGIAPGNHTAYIRIKIASNSNQLSYATDNDTILNFEKQKIINNKNVHILVVPVEIEVYQHHGIYSPNPIIDFGRITNADIEKTIHLDLNDSTGKKSFEILNYQVKNVNNLIKIDKNTLNLTLTPKNIETDCVITGEIVLLQSVTDEVGVIYSQRSLEITIPVKAEIFKGSLDFDSNLLIFITGLKNFTKNKDRIFWVENKFDIAISIINYAIDSNSTNLFNFVQLQKFPLTIQPNDKLDLFRITIKSDETATNNLNTILRIATNLTVYEVPFVIASGKLDVFTSFDPEKLTISADTNVLDYGTVPYGDYSHSGYILIRNINPFAISINEWNVIAPARVNYHSSFWGCIRKGLFSDIKQIGDEIVMKSKLINRDDFLMCQNIAPNSMAMFQLDIESFNVKANSALFKMWTDYEEIVTNVKFVTVMGRLEIDKSKLHFSDCFPGKQCSADISIHSTFLKTMIVNGISVNVPGINFDQTTFPNITANAITHLSRIYFDPKAICTENCYIPYESLHFDETELRRRTELFRHFKWSLQHITFKLNTSEVRLFEFRSSVDIIWPKLVDGIQTLQLTEIGQIFNGKIRINNPSDQVIIVHLNLSDPSKAKTTRLSLPLEVVDICVNCYLTDQDVYEITEKKLLIPPKSFRDIIVKFKPKDPGVYSTLLHIGNNLTLYEAVWITAKSVQPQFRFANRKPGSLTPLLFEINEKHLTSCDKAAQNNLNKKFTSSQEDLSEDLDNDIIVMVSTKRTFTARNTGEVPIWIEYFKIGDQICEGYGFKVLDCQSFVLKANSSKKIEIAFTPDFTLSRITLPLILKTNLSYSVNYTLVATIPPGSLEQCSKMLQRPSWEHLIQKLAIFSLVISLFLVLFVAFLDSDKILKDHVNNMAKDKGPVQPALDLRNIAMRCEKEDLIDTNTTGNSDRMSTVTANGKSHGNLKKRSTRKITSNAIKEKSWAEEFVKNFTSSVISKKSVDDQINSNNKISNEKNLLQSNSNKTKEYTNDKNSTSSKILKAKENGVDIKLSSKENRKSGNETNNIDKRQSNNFDQHTTEISKRSKIALKKAKSAPLPVSNDSSSNTSGSPVNPYKCDIETKSSNKQKLNKEKLPDVVKQTEAAFQNKNNSDYEDTLIDQSISPSTSKATNESTGKKYGKTPGRERKKDNEKSAKRSEKKIPKFKGNAFQFSLPVMSNTNGTDSSSQSTKSPTSSDNSLVSNIWNNNQNVSFSHVVSQNTSGSSNLEDKSKTLNISNELKNSCEEKDCCVSKSNNDRKYVYGSAMFNDYNDWNDIDLKNAETFGSEQIDENGKKNSFDLGPIGTRKSPTSTPTIWEPLQPGMLESPKPNISPSSLAGTSNFFSTNLALNENNMDLFTNQPFGGTSDLLNLISAKRWQPDELFLSLLQHQQQQQQAKFENNNWPVEDTRQWTPMGYQSERNLSSIWEQQDHQSHQNKMASVAGTARPPPGLTLPNLDLPSNTKQIEKQFKHQQIVQQFLLQQQVRQQQQQQLQQQQQHQHQLQFNSQIDMNNMGNSQQFNQPTTSQNLMQHQQQQQQSNQQLFQQQSMQQFDLFQSWNPVWSNAWGENKNQDANKK